MLRVNTSDQILKKWKNEAPELSWELYEKDARHQIPMGRIGNTNEAAKVITLLVSSAASYVTGTAVNIDGGRSGVLKKVPSLNVL